MDLLFLSKIFFDGNVAIEPGISDHKLFFFTWNKALDRSKNIQSCKATLVKDFAKEDDEAITDYL